MNTMTTIEDYLSYCESAPLRSIFSTCLEACREVSSLFQKLQGSYSAQVNATGDQQLNLDIAAHQLFVKYLSNCQEVWGCISEEGESLIENKNSKGEYLIAFDPIDGSSVATAGLAVGSMIGIYHIAKGARISTKKLVGSLYAFYGSSMFVGLSYGKGVSIFKENEKGQLLNIKSNIVLGDESRICSPGSMKAYCTHKGYLALIKELSKQKFKLRASGSLTADLHLLLMQGGGLFLYPGDKLRLLYECAPAAYLVTQAGGAASNAEDAILTLQADEIHSTTPIILGTKDFVETAAFYLRT